MSTQKRERVENESREDFQPYKYEAQTAVFKDPVRTAL
jgi:hypothetical protein